MSSLIALALHFFDDGSLHDRTHCLSEYLGLIARHESPEHDAVYCFTRFNLHGFEPKCVGGVTLIEVDGPAKVLDMFERTSLAPRSSDLKAVYFFRE